MFCLSSQFGRQCRAISGVPSAAVWLRGAGCVSASWKAFRSCQLTASQAESSVPSAAPTVGKEKRKENDHKVHVETSCNLFLQGFVGLSEGVKGASKTLVLSALLLQSCLELCLLFLPSLQQAHKHGNYKKRLVCQGVLIYPL